MEGLFPSATCPVPALPARLWALGSFGPGKLTSTGNSNPWILEGPSDGRLEQDRAGSGYPCPALPASARHFWQWLVFLQAHGSRLVAVPPRLPYSWALVASFLLLLVQGALLGLNVPGWLTPRCNSFKRTLCTWYHASGAATSCRMLSKARRARLKLLVTAASKPPCLLWAWPWAGLGRRHPLAHWKLPMARWGV